MDAQYTISVTEDSYFGGCASFSESPWLPNTNNSCLVRVFKEPHTS